MGVSMANTSARVNGYPIGPLAFLASMSAAWDSMDVYGSLVWGICMARMCASMVVKN
jgi:hypothetical protein